MVGIMATVIMALFAAWINLNKRIDVLEIQVQNDHQLLVRWNENMEEMRSNVSDIRARIIQLQDLKEDRKFKEDAHIQND
jgi:flagellar biosynthesis chaperone FliJ